MVGPFPDYGTQFDYRGQAWRYPNLSTDQIRVRHQSENRQRTRPYHSARTARGRRRGDRMRRRAVLVGLLAFPLVSRVAAAITVDSEHGAKTQVRMRLSAGRKWIRTPGSARDCIMVEVRSRASPGQSSSPAARPRLERAA